jgi:mannosyl-oligosaccharide glucosidase
MAYHLSGQRSLEEVYGHTPEFRQFRMYLPRKTVATEAHHSFLSARVTSAADLSSYIRSVMVQEQGPSSWPPLTSLPGEVRPDDGSALKPNLVAYQVTTTIPFELDIVMETGLFSTVMSVSGERLSSALETREKNFDLRFENTFHLKDKGFSDSEVDFAKAAFSNLIGGMAYFYGQSKVTARDLAEPLDYWPAALYTAVPSRSFFPRGFLWDEGFHQLLAAHWDTTITKDVLAHWLDLINSEGWIPREQILGDEARSKVPAEFIVQHNENANPPTFFITMETLLSRMEAEGSVDVRFLSLLYPRLQTWFSWFNTTQFGERPLTYRWRGRNGTTDKELNPKTLTSGLDDFPRSSHPSPSEYHVDLYCWMTLASGVMARIADILGKDSSLYWSTHHSLSDPHTLDSLHWDRERKTYSDYGLHTSAVKLVRVTPPSPHQPSFKRRKVTKEPVMRFVNSFGYVQLFPFLLKMVPPSSQKLGIILTRLRNTSLLWTKYGLRSLAKNDPFYNKFNTEHDPPYWRGAIWLNMNYLAVRALHHYGNTEGPYQTQAHKLYQQLRSNLISNLHQQYVSTGYVWEQYDDKTGQGKGTHPFTGWSSLIVLIMAEKY